MTRHRFDLILDNLQLTTRKPPSSNVNDKFWEVRELIDEFNKNMAEQFSPSWVTCLDKSMSIWFSRYTCPGWTFVPQKPHPFGNEYHTIACALTNIIFAIEIVEGKDRPRHREIDPMSKLDGKPSKTVGLLMRLCKSIYSTGRVVILDSGFCVLRGLIELKKVGVFASAVIKKRRYWPAHIDGEGINDHMEGMRVGQCDQQVGEWHNQRYSVFCMKETTYTMKLMSTYASLIEKPGRKEERRRSESGEIHKFKLTEPFANHYDYRHAVDDNNNLRHQVPSIETTWVTSRWACRVFAFIIALCEVNTFLAFRYFILAKE